MTRLVTIWLVLEDWNSLASNAKKRLVRRYIHPCYNSFATCIVPQVPIQCLYVTKYQVSKLSDLFSYP